MNGKSKFKVFANIFLFFSLFLLFLTIVFAICRCFIFKDYFDNLFNKEVESDSPYLNELYNYLDNFLQDGKEYEALLLDFESDQEPEVVLEYDNTIEIIYKKDDTFNIKEFNDASLVMLYDYDNLTPTWSIYIKNDTYDFNFTRVIDDILEEDDIEERFTINSYLTYYDFINSYGFYEFNLDFVSFTKDNLSSVWDELSDDVDCDNYFTTEMNNLALASLASEIKRVENEKETTDSIVNIAQQTGDFIMVNDYVLKCGEYQGTYIDYVIDSNGNKVAALKNVSFTLNKDSSYYYNDDYGNYTVNSSDFKLNDKDLSFVALGNNLFYLASQDIVFSYVN